MRKPDVIGPADKRLFWPASIRSMISAGVTPPIYTLNRPDYDRVPLDTFLISSEMGTAGRLLRRLTCIVRPNHPENYNTANLTPHNRLLLVCWRGGMAVKSLGDARQDRYRHIVMPGEPGHEIIAAFKVACDTRRGWNGRPTAMPPDLLYRALGLTYPPDELR